MKLKNKNLFQEKCLINGKFISGTKTIDVSNPANNKKIGSVPDLGKKETKDTIKQAQKAFEQWKNYSPQKRSHILRNWFELIIENSDDLALILTTEQGKPLSEAKNEIIYGANFVEFYAEEAKRIKGETILAPNNNQKIITEPEPVGVVAAITPWNFPSAMITRKVSPALSAGCSVVLKPSELTPFSALALGYLATKAGIPDGVLNIITGQAKAIGEELCENVSIRKLSFTGSTKIGKLLNTQCACDIKKISLELGGNAPFIICKDANIDLAIKGVMHAKFRNGGQACTCVNRILVDNEIHDEFTKKLIKETKKLTIGDGTNPQTKIGPMINKAAKEKISNLLADAIQNGAKVELGNKKDKDQFFTPTILTNVTNNMKIAKEEIFGPIAAIQTFNTVDEAIKRANDTNYGLGSYIYAQNQSTIFKISNALQFGMVAINHDSFATELAPFGGIKHSGFGREGSSLGIKEFQNIKTLHIKF
ncbi:MAG: NAD-dependent succinate-semialdehyde dehydrogenase [Rickettsiales bacterium]|nr:NAD-dependent succinate-semialdehyde dehydrogenase [Rickettsiales bacterium]